MKPMKRLKVGMLSLACFGMIVPTPVLQASVAGQGSAQQIARTPLGGGDIVLRPDGSLAGQVVDVNGRPLGGAQVSVRYGDREVAVEVTDKSGHFRVKGLRTGTCELVVGQVRETYRIWAPKTAPPSARPGVLFVAGKKQVRGQQSPLCGWLSNPCFLVGALITAAAIAVPVAIHNSRRPSSP